MAAATGSMLFSPSCRRDGRAERNPAQEQSGGDMGYRGKASFWLVIGVRVQPPRTVGTHGVVGIGHQLDRFYSFYFYHDIASPWQTQRSLGPIATYLTLLGPLT